MTRFVLPRAVARSRAWKIRQRGVASIEFGLTILLLLLVFFGIVSYGALFLAKQMVSHAAGEGARAALATAQRGRDAGGAGLATVAGEAGCRVASPPDEGANWLGTVCTATPQACPWNTGGGAGNCVSIAVTYDTTGWPLLNTMRGLAQLFGPRAAGFLPAQLHAAAIVQISPELSP